MAPSIEHGKNGSKQRNASRALKSDSRVVCGGVLLYVVLSACLLYGAFHRLSRADFWAVFFLYAAFSAAFLLWLNARRRLSVSNAIVAVITETMGGCCWEWNFADADKRFSLIPDGRFLFGKSVSAFGDLLALIHPDDVSAFKRNVEGFYAADGGAFRGKSLSAEFRIQSVHGQWRWFAVRSGFEEFSGSRLVRATGGLLDIDEYYRAKEAIRESEQRLSVIFQNAPGAMAVTDNSGKIVEANQAFCDILGYGADELRGTPIMSLSAVSYEEEGCALMENLRLKLESCEDRHFRTEEEFLRRNGARVAVSYGLSSILDYDGNVMNYIFSGTDITLQKKHSAELDLLAERERKHAQRLQKLHDLVHSLLHAQNRDHLLRETLAYLKATISGSACSVYVFVANKAKPGSPKLERLAGYGEESPEEGVLDPDAQVMKSILANSPFVEHDEKGAETRYISPIFFQTRSVGAVEIRKSAGMSPSELEIYRLLIDYVSGFWTLYDLLAQREEEASIDPLTGIWNRRYMIRRLQEESDRIARYGGNACLVLGDMGNFKRINDTYGHIKGDEALIRTASAIRDHLRISDNVGRYGGDEFLLLLTNITKEDAETVLARIQRELSQMKIAADDDDPNSPAISVTIDFGMAFFPNGALSLMDTIALADEAMYANKSARKERLKKELLERADPELEAALKERP
ncbi:MAG: diguanylate cyclase [Synergistaceae bacterium]|jgi:diguanylate cyclase (GGDEF)-like protein/PAS domain S-box-containing protein|nr:diguanylate cyclase [Synergistaceae bacterium]